MRSRLALAVLLAASIVAAAGCGRRGFDTGNEGGPQSDSTLEPNPDGDGGGVVSAIKPIQAGPIVIGSGGNVTPTLPKPTVAGDLVVATIAMSGTTGMTPPPSWSVAAIGGANMICYVAIAYYPNNAGGITSATFSFAGGISCIAQLSEWSGVAADPLDEFGMVTAPAGTTATVATSLPTSHADDLGITAFCQYATMATYMPESGWTNLGYFSSPGTNGGHLESDYRRALPQGTISETVTSSYSAQWGGVIATFHP